ncbi:DUF3800 domain-containing protein [Sciscionella marina]|uniref:DUF3800 domain-containing protein n=1 Tax=Sciscionella marina TaxID=508770 RepID=UPI0012F65A92|nr:DUF3800 domain-containing protein [Sciscionella marina]
MSNLKPPERPRLLAFVDESGHSARSPTASSHFVLAAVAFAETDAPKATELIADLKRDTGQSEKLHWQKASHHFKRLRMAQLLGLADWLTISGVVTCKSRLNSSTWNAQTAYNYATKLLLERLSWLAESRAEQLDCKLSHVRGGHHEEHLGPYLRELKLGKQNCGIDWSAVHHIEIVDPSSDESLDLADIAASGIASAFEVDEFGSYETRYLRRMRERFYRKGQNLFSYGLKVFPDPDGAETHPWLPELARTMGVDAPG